jgi:hypothetical protein
MVVDAAWLTDHGFSRSLRSQYVAAGWLEKPAERVYRRPLGALTWQNIVISLQSLLNHDLVVGGRTALELQGYAHYLSHRVPEAHLYGPKPPPSWLDHLQLGVTFRYHNSKALFEEETPTEGLGSLLWSFQSDRTLGDTVVQDSVTTINWGGQHDWPMAVSTPERALLELLDELPSHESFDQVDALVGGLTNLRPRRLQALLQRCRSIKVKRLFFFFADRHDHAWLKRIDRSKVDLGSGKRLLVRGGKYDPRYRITVPEDLHGVQ